GAYEFAHIALFYCALFPAGHALSVDRWLGRVSGEPSADARLGLRLLQLHLCVVYLASGVEKATGQQWWNGEAVWRAVMRPDFAVFDMAWLADWPWVARLACWGTLAIEIGYAVLVWPRWTRRAMALATVGLHLGIGIFLGLWSFVAGGNAPHVAGVPVACPSPQEKRGRAGPPGGGGGGGPPPPRPR